MLAYNLVHGGPPPNFLNPILYTSISQGLSQAKPGVSDILDPILRDQLNKVIYLKNNC